MSLLKVNQIADAAGTGASAFPFGILGITTGTPAAAGTIGEIISFTPIIVNTGATWENTGSISLTPGLWLVLGGQNGSGSATDLINLGVSAANSGFPSLGSVSTTLGLGNLAIIAPSYLSLSSSATYYLMANRSIGYASSWGNGSTVPFAVRIA